MGRPKLYHTPEELSAARGRWNRAWEAKHQSPEQLKSYRRKRDLMRRFGMTEEEYKERLKSQNGVCAICKTDNWSGRNGVPMVDHDHVTGTVRGLLCNGCNSALGHLRDDPSLAEQAADYLRTSRSL